MNKDSVSRRRILMAGPGVLASFMLPRNTREVSEAAPLVPRHDLTRLAAQTITDRRVFLDESAWTWVAGDFAHRVDGSNIVEAGDLPSALGAWIRQPSKATWPSRVAPTQVLRVEEFGAVGDGVTDDRAAIQKAIDTATSLGIERVTFGAPRYAIRHTHRTGPDDIHANWSGHGLVVDGHISLESTCGCTDLYFLSPDGKNLQLDWQRKADAVWRGAGIFVRGSVTDPGKHRRNSLVLRGIYLNGGTTYTGNGTFPADITTGDGWDVTHKGVWAENDRFVGDIALYDSGVIGFRGELLYQGGLHNGGLVLRNVQLAESNANAINPNVAAFVDIDGVSVRNVYQGFEGWGGTRGRIVNAVFDQVHNGASRLSGGTINLDPGEFFYAPKEMDSRQASVLEVDALFRNCGNVWLGSFLTGQLTLIDTSAYVAPLAMGDYTTATSVRINSWADRASFDALTMYGASPVPHSDLRLEIHTHRTQQAIAKRFCVQSPVFGKGPLGEGIRIVDGSGPVAKWPRIAPGGYTGVQPIYQHNHWTLVSGDESAADQISVDHDTIIAPRSSNVYLIATKPGRFRISFVSAMPNGYREGSEFTIYCDAAYGASFLFLDGKDAPLLGDQHTTRLVAGGQRFFVTVKNGTWTVQGARD